VQDMSSWMRFLLAVLATWRVTHLLANEDGPAGIIARFRAVLGDSWIGGLMDCFNCLSLWIAAPAAFLLSRRPGPLLLSWLALSGAACLLEHLREKSVVLESSRQTPGGNTDVLR
jgi:hypothetical protein